MTREADDLFVVVQYEPAAQAGPADESGEEPARRPRRAQRALGPFPDEPTARSYADHTGLGDGVDVVRFVVAVPPSPAGWGAAFPDPRRATP